MGNKKKGFVISIAALIIFTSVFLNRKTIMNYLTTITLSEEETQVVEAADELVEGIYVTAISENDEPYIF